MSILTMHSQHSKHTEEVQRTERFSSLHSAGAVQSEPRTLTPPSDSCRGQGTVRVTQGESSDGLPGDPRSLRVASDSVSSIYPQVPVRVMGASAKKEQSVHCCVCVCVCVCVSTLKKDLLSILLKSVTWDKAQLLWPSFWTTQLLLLLPQQQQPSPCLGWRGEQSPCSCEQDPGPWATPAEDVGPALCWQMSGAVRRPGFWAIGTW